MFEWTGKNIRNFNTQFTGYTKFISYVEMDGGLILNNILNYAGTDGEYLVLDNNGAINYRTKSQVSTDINVAASATVSGIVELATSAETNTGTDTGRAVTPDGLEDWEGSAQVTTLGTIATGVWNGTAVASAYLDADTAHLSGSQTFTGTKTLNSFKRTAGATVTNILDEDAMGSDSATALATQQSIKAYVDTRYSTSYITFSAQSNSSYGTNYIFVSALGISESTFNKDSGVDSAGDFGGVTVEQGGSGTDATVALATSNLEQQIVIPETCKLIGFYATGSAYNTSSGHTAGYDVGVAIWHQPEANVNWGASTTGTATLIHKSDSSIHSENTAHGGNNRKKVQMIKRMDGTAKDLAEGDILIPSIFGETSNQQIMASITLVIATPIK